MRRTACTFAAAATLALFAGQPGQALAQTKPAAGADAVSPEIRTALGKMADAMKALETFEVRADMTTEEVLDDGQKLQSSALVTISARRPDRFFIDVDSERRQRRVYYDGKQLTIYGPVKGYYATVDAPPTSREVVDMLADRYGVDTPLADLLEWGASGVKLDQVQSAMYAGSDRIGTAACEHYAFRQEGTDWQLWIRKDGDPLPCKLVIVNTDDPAQPQSVAVFNWSSGQQIAESTFQFAPPSTAMRIQLGQAGTTAWKGPSK